MSPTNHSIESNISLFILYCTDYWPTELLCRQFCYTNWCILLGSTQDTNKNIELRKKKKLHIYLNL